MKNNYNREGTIPFRPSTWERALIEQRAELSGLFKKDFIIKSCIYANVVVVGRKENVQRIVDSLQEMQEVMRDIAGQIMSGNFCLNDNSFQEMKEEYLALAITVVEILNGAAYLFEKEAPAVIGDWKEELK